MIIYDNLFANDKSFLQKIIDEPFELLNYYAYADYLAEGTEGAACLEEPFRSILPYYKAMDNKFVSYLAIFEPNNADTLEKKLNYLKINKIESNQIHIDWVTSLASMLHVVVHKETGLFIWNNKDQPVRSKSNNLFILDVSSFDKMELLYAMALSYSSLTRTVRDELLAFVPYLKEIT